MRQADLKARSRELWGERYGRAITGEEAQETTDNMVAFAELIIEWYMNEKKRDGDFRDSDGGV